MGQSVEVSRAQGPGSPHQGLLSTGSIYCSCKKGATGESPAFGVCRPPGLAPTWLASLTPPMQPGSSLLRPHTLYLLVLLQGHAHPPPFTCCSEACPWGHLDVMSSRALPTPAPKCHLGPLLLCYLHPILFLESIYCNLMYVCLGHCASAWLTAGAQKKTMMGQRDIVYAAQKHNEFRMQGKD